VTRSRRRRGGFSLVELLAAMVLMGLVLPAVMRCVTMAMGAAAHARSEHEAALLARQKIDEALVLRDPGAIGTGGAFDGFPRYRWESRVDQANFGLRQLTVTVTWNERDQPRTHVAATMILPSTGVITR